MKSASVDGEKKNYDFDFWRAKKKKLSHKCKFDVNVIIVTVIDVGHIAIKLLVDANIFRQFCLNFSIASV